MKKDSSARQPAFTSHNMAVTAAMASVICILGPLSIAIPISPVPISFTNLAVCFSIYVLGWKLGTISYLLYLLIGLAGIPVFSGFTSGFIKLAGPTGGYLIGFIFMAIICGLVIESTTNPVLQFLGLVSGFAVNDLFGTIWLCHVAHLSFVQGLWAGVIPYIPGDLIKIILVICSGPHIRKRIQATGLL